MSCFSCLSQVIADNICRAREVAVLAARPGWRGGRFCGRRDNGHLSEGPKACSREHCVIRRAVLVELFAPYSDCSSSRLARAAEESDTSMAFPTMFDPGKSVSARILSLSCCVSFFFELSLVVSVHDAIETNTNIIMKILNNIFVLR